MVMVAVNAWQCIMAQHGKELLWVQPLAPKWFLNAKFVVVASMLTLTMI
jgi:hypothetical protein